MIACCSKAVIIFLCLIFKTGDQYVLERLIKLKQLQRMQNPFASVCTAQ